MIPAPIPATETERLTDLRAMRILDTPPEGRFDRLVQLASHVLGVPMAYIALIDSDRQWLKARCGLTVDETGRDVSFCGHTILQNAPLVVPDATADERFFDNPLVVGEPHIRFYAGIPLKGPRGTNVGTFCVADSRPRELGTRDLETLTHLAALAQHELRMLDLIEVQHELLETKNELLATQRQLQRELTEAADYVTALLPARLDGPITTSWEFISSSQLGGDLFGYHWLDRENFVVYLLDACGHGVGASLLSISAHTALRRQTLPETRFDDPGEVLTALNNAFPMSEHNGKFFTIWYGVYNVNDRQLRYASAGHHPAVLFSATNNRPKRLGTASLMIGAVPELTYETHSQFIPAGSRLYLFSDGVFEISKNDGEMLLFDGLLAVLEQAARATPPRLPQVVREIQIAQGTPEFDDDFSLLEVEFQ